MENIFNICHKLDCGPWQRWDWYRCPNKKKRSFELSSILALSFAHFSFCFFRCRQNNILFWYSNFVRMHHCCEKNWNRRAEIYIIYDNISGLSFNWDDREHLDRCPPMWFNFTSVCAALYICFNGFYILFCVARMAWPSFHRTSVGAPEIDDSVIGWFITFMRQ